MARSSSQSSAAPHTSGGGQPCDPSNGTTRNGTRVVRNRSAMANTSS